jgi:hypothetical protein
MSGMNIHLVGEANDFVGKILYLLSYSLYDWFTPHLVMKSEACAIK